MKTEKINIEGMRCEHCTASVTSALSSISGVTDVKVSLNDSNAEITYDEALANSKTFTDVIEDLGFIVK